LTNPVQGNCPIEFERQEWGAGGGYGTAGVS
jgi:hypothetical protein